MARIRSIKPEFFTSEQIADCSPNARLLFIGMWCFCDDQGIHPASVKTLKMQIFPADHFSIEQVQDMVDELLNSSLMIEYDVDNKRYWKVTGWNHQKIDRPNSKYPLPNKDESINRLPDELPNTRRKVAERSPEEGKGEEGKGVEGKGMDTSSPLPPKSPEQESPPTTFEKKIKNEETIKNGYHQINIHPRFNEIREFIIFRLPHLKNTNATEINRWLHDGADPETDIFPSIENSIEFKRGDIGSFSYFTRPIMSCVSIRKEREEQSKRLGEKYAKSV